MQICSQVHLYVLPWPGQVGLSICPVHKETAIIVLHSFTWTNKIISSISVGGFSNDHFTLKSNLFLMYFLSQEAIYSNVSSKFSFIWLKKNNCSLTLFVPTNSEWVASPGPSNIGLRGAKFGYSSKKTDKNAHTLIVNIAVLQSVSDTISLSSSPVYSE